MSEQIANKSPNAILLKNYLPPAYLIDSVRLDVDLRRDDTLIMATLACRRNPVAAEGQPLVLDGEDLETLSISVDGRQLAVTEYRLEPTQLVIASVPDEFVLTTHVRIRPDQNTQLSGFYRSRDGYFTQCEPEGFRRITWFIDRPDVMARYTVSLHADKDNFPVLLANGNPLDSGDEADGRHFATWEDPFAKPSYLFAMVAGKLDVLRDSYRTRSGREVQLAIYVEPGKLDQCAHAMAALKKSMRWDEQRFGLECDLDHYMIVAVGDFNMGAMENKGLNIFNTTYVLARADVATDADFENIDRVVAHEYFHNWTGNRVTCRDWFQLSLKEGLTVFRDQEFGADTHSRETARIREVRGLRAAQFPEDAGPMAHPIRPESYVEINNFYTAPVYEKGAEVVRMIHTLIGEKAFRQGMDLYFARHDGQAATCEDFVAAMGDAADFDFAPFMTWYRQAGTPRVHATGAYDAATRRFTLTLEQSCLPTPGQPEKQVYLIPVAVGLVSVNGQDLALAGETGAVTTRILQLRAAKESFVFEDVFAAPVPSLLRNFSAPVVLDYPYEDRELAHLLAHDSDAFNRWEAGQRLYGRLIRDAVAKLAQGESVEKIEWPVTALEAVRKVLISAEEPAFIAEALSLPSEATLAEQMEVVDPEILYQARTALAQFFARGLACDFSRLYETLAPTGPYRPDTVDAGRRRLRNLCLAYLNELDSDTYQQFAQQQFSQADNMTDQFAALAVLVNAPVKEEAHAKDLHAGEGAHARAGCPELATFLERWQGEALVVDKWLAVQAASRQPGTLARVEALTQHAVFDRRNPNKVYALIRGFGANHRHFHALDGSGYRFLAAQIAELDPINPQVAARLARCFDRWRRFDAARQAQACAVLTGLQQRPGLSRDVLEVVSKALGF